MVARRRPSSRRAPRRSSHVRRNLRFWEAQSGEYDRRFEQVLGGRSAMSWGLWRVPEQELQLLGAVRGRTTLELGCGAARWSVALAARGARAVGLDLSKEQLRSARRVVRAARSKVRLVRGSAESVPIRSGTFDVVFCDWGAMTFCDPHRTIPECARLLRAGGTLVFSTASPIRFLAHDRRADRQVHRLTRPYFGLHRLVFNDTTEFQLPYGEWVDLFQRNGLTIERLIETRPSAGARTPYLSANETAWGRRWPMECIWKLRRADGAPRSNAAERPRRSRPAAAGRRTSVPRALPR